MFAVIKAGGKQYRVAAEDVIRIDRIDGEPGSVVEFGDVLMLGGDNIQVGVPTISGALVAGEVLQHTRGDKVISFKKRRRKNSRRKRGSRHDFTMIRITEILTDGQKPSKTPKPRPERKTKPKPVAAETAGDESAPTAPEAAKSGGKTKAKDKAPAKKAEAKKPAKSEPAKKPAGPKADKSSKAKKK
jgi:large subunit ribosomal protein L21